MAAASSSPTSKACAPSLSAEGAKPLPTAAAGSAAATPTAAAIFAATAAAATASSTPAAAASAAVAAAAAPAVAAASATPTAGFARASLAHVDGAPLDLAAAQRGDRCGGFIVAAHLDEGKPTRASGVAVHHDFHLHHIPSPLGESLAQLELRDVVGQVSNV